MEQIDLIFMSRSFHQTDAAKTLEHEFWPANGDEKTSTKASTAVSDEAPNLNEKQNIVENKSTSEESA